MLLRGALGDARVVERPMLRDAERAGRLALLRPRAEEVAARPVSRVLTQPQGVHGGAVLGASLSAVG